MRKQMAGAAMATGALMLTGAAAYRAAEVKVAFVNVATLMEMAPGRAEAEAQLQKEGGELQKQNKVLNDSMSVLQKRAETEMGKLDSAGKAKLQKELRTAADSLEAKANKLNMAGQALQNALALPIMTLIRNSVDAIREENGYSFLVDINDQRQGGNVVVSYDKNLDITEKVIARMKIEAAKPKPASKIPLPKSGGGGDK
jgi:outer membrane protein